MSTKADILKVVEEIKQRHPVGQFKQGKDKDGQWASLYGKRYVLSDFTSSSVEEFSSPIVAFIFVLKKVRDLPVVESAPEPEAPAPVQVLPKKNGPKLNSDGVPTSGDANPAPAPAKRPAANTPSKPATPKGNGFTSPKVTVATASAAASPARAKSPVAREPVPDYGTTLSGLFKQFAWQPKMGSKVDTEGTRIFKELAKKFGWTFHENELAAFDYLWRNKGNIVLATLLRVN